MNNRYFDFFENENYRHRLSEIAKPFDLEDEIIAARLKINDGIYYRSATVVREVLESLLLNGFDAPKKGRDIEDIGEIEWRIKYLYENKIINKKFSDEFHKMRQIGNDGVHNKGRIGEEEAIEALELCDRAIRYFIQERLDSTYDYQLYLPDENDSIILSTQKVIEENETLVKNAKNMNQERKESLTNDNKVLKEDLDLLKQIESLTSQLSESESERQHEKTIQKEVSTFKKARKVKEKILSEVDWIYKVLQGKGSATVKQNQAINAVNNVYKINGPAGSGKSLVLLIKCIREIDRDTFANNVKGQETLPLDVATHKRKAILITYNKSLKSYLQSIIDNLLKSPFVSEQMKDSIECLTIENIDKYIFDLSRQNNYKAKQYEKDYEEKYNNRLAFLNTHANIPKYDIVAIDEAQDLSLDTIQLIYKMRKAEEESKFYIVFDEAQKIYKGDFTAKAIDSDLNFRGNAINLEKNLRNHPNIDKLAKAILEGEVNQLDDIDQEYLNHNVIKLNKTEVIKETFKADESIAVLFKYNSDVNKFNNQLEQLGLKAKNIKENMSVNAGLYSGTIYSAKGLEFDKVYIMHFPDGKDYKELRYVACSRARNQLIIVQ